LSLKKSFIYRNKSTFSGAGIAVSNNTETIDFENNVVFNNLVTNGNGGGIFIQGNGTITNCTTSNNAGGQGPEINVSLGYPTLKNNVFANSMASSNTTYIGYNQANTNNVISGFSGTATYFANPNNPEGADGILGTADDGLNLACNSEARDFADNSFAPATDIVGNTVYNVQRDAGAYERQSDAGCEIYTGTVN
jgi:hypothetical protein